MMKTFAGYMVEDRSPYYGKTFFHGTNSDFDSFDFKFFGRTDNGFVGRGFYLTGDEKLASMYAAGSAAEHGGNANVLKFKVFPKKTLELTSTGTSEWVKAMESLGINRSDSTESQTKELVNLGYDSIAVNRNGKTREFVLFDPKLAKKVK